MSMIDSGHRLLLPEAFHDDPHAARYRRVVDSFPAAFARLLGILNDPEAERALVYASTQGQAALRGVAPRVTGDATILTALVDDEHGLRVRQAVGVAVRLKMERLGWRTSGRRGPVGPPFTNAEKYVPAGQAPSAAAGALAALDRVAAIGSEDERRETGERLQGALRATRAEQHRPF